MKKLFDKVMNVLIVLAILFDIYAITNYFNMDTDFISVVDYSMRKLHELWMNI